VNRTGDQLKVENPAATRRRRVGHAETVADDLRRRILSGELADGQVLPKQEDLVVTYRVSKAALRDALRILETEGLLSVRRGNVGGAVVHLPRPGTAAYTLGLVLESRGVSFAEVQVALRQLEPVCAGLCAARSDRRRAVLPSLSGTQRRLRRAIQVDDSDEALAATRDFHEALVTGCGNETLIIVVGTLEAIWTAQAQVSGRLATAAGSRQDPVLRRLVLAEHDELVDCIKRGDVDAAVSSCRTHLQHARLHNVSPPDGAPVDTRMIRDLLVLSPAEGNRQ
jgi:GntR family transcriptional repressor for pyruvate dehydrogenase complex